MPEKYVDRFLKLCSSERECQGLCIKLPFMKDFAPVLEVEEVSGEPEMLKVQIGSSSSAVTPRIPGETCDVVQNYFVHKSQVIFRECERWPEV